MTRFRQYLALACLTATGSIASAQQDPTAAAEEETPEIRRYSVEFIIFRYAEPVSVGTEVFIPDIIEPPPEVPEGFMLDENGNLVPAAPPGFDGEPEEEPLLTDAEVLDDPLAPVFEVVFTPDDQLTLGNYWDAFRRLDVYEPLLHGGWTQTALGEDAVMPIDLREFGILPDGLTGEFTLYLSRFLHLVVDLELLAPRDEQPYQYPGSEEESLYAPLVYRIEENRIFRSEEVRYYDHPKFGVIAKIVRVEDEAPDDDDIPDDTEFLLPPEPSTGGS